jgi:16S rRNA (guanine(527)-N(7))-methyltransferase RsmG
MNIDIFEKYVSEYFSDNTAIKEKILSKTDIYSKYVDAVLKWNRKINITGFNEEKFIFNGILEPLLVFKKFRNFDSSTITDIGAGAGIPSITLSVFFDKAFVNIVEINKKKSAFLNYVKFSVGIKNIAVLKRPPEKSHLITSRAFMDIFRFLDFIKKNSLKFKYLLFFFKGEPPPNLEYLHCVKYVNPFNSKDYTQSVIFSNK